MIKKNEQKNKQRVGVGAVMFQSSTTDRSGAAAGRQGKPVKPKKKWRIVLKVIIIIVLVKILINITLANYFSPDNKVKRYLHAKYGSNRELSVDGGCFAYIELDGGQQQGIEWRQVILMIVYLALPLPDLSWWRLWEWPDPVDQFCRWQASFKDDSGHRFNVWLDDNYGNRSLRSIKMERGGLK